MGIASARKFKTCAVLLLGMVLLWETTLASKKFVKVYFPDGDSLSAELAITQEEKERGLMFRKRLNFDQGMLFVFGEKGFHSFWMKNMSISLDFIWLDEDRRIVHIEKNVPPCEQEPCPTYTSKVPAMYFLELRAGSVEKRRLKILDRLDFVLPE